jgi:enediyne biosynthesis protein E4
MMRCTCLVLAATLFSACTRSALTREETSSAPFREAAIESGLVFRHDNGASGKFHLVEIMGSGVALFDYDSDGDLDAYLIQGNPTAGGNKLFRNETVPSGKLRYTDVTESAGVGYAGWGMGAAVGDYDSDGDLDLLATNHGRNVLYRNDGSGHFTDVSRLAGVESSGWHTSASFFDYDKDGDLDLFVARYVDFNWTNARTCHGPTGSIDYCTPKAYNGLLHRLFRNAGNGTFVDATVSSGINEPAPGLGVAVVDANSDNWLDLYVANDGAANQLWVNQHNGRFRNEALEYGVAYSEDGTPQAGMGIAVGDYNLDGRDDIIVTNLTREGAALYRSDDDGRYTEVAAISRLKSLTLANTGFGSAWVDRNNDGTLDLFIANGAVTVMEAQRGKPHPFRQPAQFLQCRDGQFVESAPLGLVEVGRGVAVGDVDNDGDLDVMMTTNNGPVRLLLNGSRRSTNWLSAELSGSQAIGVRVAVGQGDRILWRRYTGDGSYLSASTESLHFTLTQPTSPLTLHVEWQDGKNEQWPVMPASKLKLMRGTAPLVLR